MTFKEYLRIHRARGYKQIDFLYDAKNDTRLPEIQSWPQLKDYLKSNNACWQALDGAEAVWRAYKKRYLDA